MGMRAWAIAPGMKYHADDHEREEGELENSLLRN
jgi:hypothetical protein